MNWDVVFTGKIWQVTQGLHSSGKVFEKAVRSPGSRIILVKDGAVLLSQERRRELGGKTDFRLPGGKVFDTNDEYNMFLSTGQDMQEESRSSITREAAQEVGVKVDPQKLMYLGTDVLGATCEWDLYYWVSEDFVEIEAGTDHQDTEVDEIEGSAWVPFDKAKQLALDPSQFSESRSARMLLTYIASK